MVSYVPRSAWTSEDAGGDTLSGHQLVGLAVHWPGTTTDRFGVETADEVASRIDGWWDYHVNGRGWSDVGYNFAIDQAGRVWELRGIDRVGAHCASDSNPDANHEWLGVLLILGDSEEPTTAMVQAFRHFRTHTFLERWPGRTQIRGHQQVPGAETDCPGPYALELVNAGALAGAPRPEDPEDDDMPYTPTQIKAMFKEALGEALKPDTGDTDVRNGIVLLFQDVVLKDPDVRHEIATAVLDYRNPGVARTEGRSFYQIVLDTEGAVGE